MSTLYDYLLLQKDGAEVTVLDNVYDIETYFYNQPNDEWDNIMFDLAKKLQIVKISIKLNKYFFFLFLRKSSNAKITNVAIIPCEAFALQPLALASLS